MASAYLEKTYTNNGNRRTMTFSFWMKVSKLDTNMYPMSIYDSSSGNQADIRHSSANQLRMYATGTDATARVHLVTNRVFRDINAWYHIVWQVDTTQATESNRVKLYVNGVQETSFGTETYPPQNTDLRWNGNNSADQGGVTQVGAIGGNGDWDGQLAHFHFIDGTAYPASTFGETDSTTGIWKPKTSPSVTYGTNGFFLKFDNSANMGLDSSGAGNNFTTTGTIIQNKDTPTNVFATLNPLQTGSASVSNAPLTNTNNTFTSNEGSSVYPYYFSTLGVSSGKYYAEFKFVNAVSGTAGIGSGVADQYSGNNAYDYSYYYDGRLYNNGSGESTGYSAISNNDILGCALDLDNNKLYFHINGSYQASGNPATGAGGKSITAAASNGTGFYQFEVGDSGSTSPTTIQANFGNGYFGTTAVSSAQNPDDGIGIFEYDVPAGYRALCTKSINAEEYS